jgi:hypothetical protein
MKHDHPHHKPHTAPAESLTGTYRQPIYSPKGELEGLLIEVDGAAVQLVLDPHEHDAAFERLVIGQTLTLEATPSKPSPKGEAAHPVFQLKALTAVDGKKPAAGTPARKLFKGRVELLNYAKHGEPNGVVLDSGDFIHLHPEGFRDAALKIGDTVAAEGDAEPKIGGGFVVEATRVNDIALAGKKPHHGPKHGPGHHPKPHAAH